MLTHPDLDIFGPNASLEKFLEKLETGVGDWAWIPLDDPNFNQLDSKNPLYRLKHPGNDRLPEARICLAWDKDNCKIWCPNITPDQPVGSINEQQYSSLQVDFINASHDACEELGLHVSQGTSNISVEDFLSQQALKALKSFSNGANKSSGNSHPRDRSRWFDFVIEAKRSNAILNGDILRAWLVENDWDDQSAWDLSLDYEREIYLLDHLEQYETDHQ